MDIEKAKTRFSGAEHQETTMPQVLQDIDEENIVDLDVRDDLRSGREPFSQIMSAQQTVEPGGALRLRAIFEPVPLYAALRRFGFSSWTRRLADDDWEVWFYRGELPEAS